VSRSSSTFFVFAITLLPFTLVLREGRKPGLHQNPPIFTDASGKSTYTVINGIRLHALEWGQQGPSIVLIHGLYDNADVWKSLAPLLAVDWHILAPDLPQADDSGVSKKDLDTQTQINDLMALIRSRKLSPVTLVGHSAGAEIALRTASQHPEVVRSVIMIDGGFWPARHDYDPDSLYPRVSSPVLLVMARQNQPSVDVLKEYQRQGIDYFDQLKKAEKHVTEVAASKLQHGKMVVIENTSHWVQKDQPMALALAIKDFLSGIR
jgi:pimeloyl-ACP methyl ester carboxylesterase